MNTHLRLLGDLFVVIVLCMLLGMLSGCGKSREYREIKKVVDQVEALVQLGEESNDMPQLVVALREIDTSRCPKDFQIAFLSLVHVFEDIEKFNKKASSWSLFGKAFLRGLMGDPFGVAFEVDSEASRLQSRLEDALKELELVSLRHGYS